MMRAITALLALALLTAPGWGQAAQPRPAPDGKGQVILSWDEFIRITGFDPARRGSQTLTIPWAEVEKLIGADIQVKPGLDKTTVDLPWDDFKALLQWSLDRKKVKDEGPPVDYLLASAAYSGDLTADGAKFTLKAKIQLLKAGWKRIGILPAAVALTESTLPAGVFISAAGDKYELLTDKVGEIDVTLKFDAAVQTASGISRVNVPRVAPGAGVLDLKIDPADVEAKVAGAQSVVSKAADGKMNVAAALPAGVPIDISWERALPKAAPVPTKLYAETRTLVAVAEGVLMCQETVNFNILHTAVRELKLQAPAGASVLEVTGPTVQDWRAAADGTLTVMLRGEAIGPYVLRVVYERPAGETVEVPVVRAIGVEREKGFVAVIALTNVEITAGEVTGATGIDVRQLPPDIVAMTNQPVLLAFRYVTDKFAIPLAVKRHEQVGVLVTIADSAVFTAMQLNDGRRITKAVYNVRNNRNQFLRMTLPGLAEIWSCSVDGKTVSPAKEAGKVLIPLVRSTPGARELASFPVELVYVETPKQQAPDRGTLQVDLPASDAPTMHVMFEFYAPAEGKYTVGWGEPGFSGLLRLVDQFTPLAGAPAKPGAEAADQAKQLQQQVDARVDAQARAAGVQPIRVELPINGKLFRLERILVLSDETLWFKVQYSNWKPPK